MFCLKYCTQASRSVCGMSKYTSLVPSQWAHALAVKRGNARRDGSESPSAGRASGAVGEHRRYSDDSKWNSGSQYEPVAGGGGDDHTLAVFWVGAYAPGGAIHLFPLLTLSSLGSVHLEFGLFLSFRQHILMCSVHCWTLLACHTDLLRLEFLIDLSQ